jgi:uncharacterized lipoprotein
VYTRGVALACVAAALLLAACGRSEQPKTDAAAEQKAAAERAREGPYGTQLKALDKAKGLQADLNKKAEEGLDRVDKMQ